MYATCSFILAFVDNINQMQIKDILFKNFWLWWEIFSAKNEKFLVQCCFINNNMGEGFKFSMGFQKQVMKSNMQNFSVW